MADNFQNDAQVQFAVDAALAEQKKKKKKKKLIILGVIAVVIVLIAVVIGGGSSDDAASSSSGDTKTSSVSAEKSKDVEGKIGNYICKVKSATVCKDWEGKEAVKITYEFTNNASEAESFDIALTDNLYQDGIGLESTWLSSDDDVDWGIDVKIKPGTTKEVSKLYKLRDKKTPIDVEISEFISLSNDKLTYTVELD